MNIAGQRVIFGSSEDLSAIPDRSVDLVLTSPPYWNLKRYGNRNEIGHESYPAYLDRLGRVWAECYRKAKPDAVLVINANTRRVNKAFYPIPMDIASRMTGWTLWDIVVWYIPNALPQPNAYRERLLDNKFEFALVFTKDGNTDYHFAKPRVPQKYRIADPRAHKRNAKGRCLGNIIRIPAYRPPNVKQLNYHIAAYPEELAAFFLQLYTKRNGVVLDPFLGSGTTLKVARTMARKGIGVEINPKFRKTIAAKIRERWAVPDWKALDLIHSSTAQPGRPAKRKSQFRGSRD